MCCSLEESVELMRCCSEVDSAEQQQCFEEIVEDQQVWEELEDAVRNLSQWEEPEPEGWGQPTNNEREQPIKSDWERSQDSGWEEPDSVKVEKRDVPETPSLEEQTDSAIMDEVVFGLAVMTSHPTTSIETTQGSSQDSMWKHFSERLQQAWRNFQSFLICCSRNLIYFLL